MTEAYAPPLIEIAGPSSGALLRRRVLGHKGLVIGATVLILIVLMALAAPLLAPHDPYAQDLSRRLIPPIWHAKGTWTFPLGTAAALYAVRFAEKKHALSESFRNVSPMNPSSESSYSRRSVSMISVGIFVWISPIASY